MRVPQSIDSALYIDTRRHGFFGVVRPHTEARALMNLGKVGECLGFLFVPHCSYIIMAVRFAIYIVVKGGSDFWAPVVNLARDGTGPYQRPILYLDLPR